MSFVAVSRLLLLVNASTYLDGIQIASLLYWFCVILTECISVVAYSSSTKRGASGKFIPRYSSFQTSKAD